MVFVEQLKSSIDIVRVVGEYVRLKRLGATGRYLGLCPFHQEKTPSFNVRSEPAVFHWLDEFLARVEVTGATSERLRVFELGLLARLGTGPSFDCVSCGRTSADLGSTVSPHQ